MFYFSGAGKFCLAHGLGQLTRDVKSVEKTLIPEMTSFLHHHEKHRMTFGKGRYAT